MVDARELFSICFSLLLGMPNRFCAATPIANSAVHPEDARRMLVSSEARDVTAAYFHAAVDKLGSCKPESEEGTSDAAGQVTCKCQTDWRGLLAQGMT